MLGSRCLRILPGGAPRPQVAIVGAASRRCRLSPTGAYLYSQVAASSENGPSNCCALYSTSVSLNRHKSKSRHLGFIHPPQIIPSTGCPARFPIFKVSANSCFSWIVYFHPKNIRNFFFQIPKLSYFWLDTPTLKKSSFKITCVHC